MMVSEMLTRIVSYRNEHNGAIPAEAHVSPNSAEKFAPIGFVFPVEGSFAHNTLSVVDWFVDQSLCDDEIVLK